MEPLNQLRSEEAPDAESAPAPAPAAVPEPEPGTLGSRVPPFFNLALFFLTFASALVAGLLLEEGSPEGAQLWPALARATSFAAALVGILLAHEMGHFVYARRHGVNASWPYFLPAPYLSFIGTFGAVIRLRSLPRTRRALIDIGASGPIFGFIATLIVIYIGLGLSTVMRVDPDLHARTLWDSIVTGLRNGTSPEIVRVDFGESLAFKAFEVLRFGWLPDDMTVNLHPVALAGWFGLLVTALNLLPLGQLDGGHILHAVSPRLHKTIGPPFSALLVGLGVFTPFFGWLLWGVLTGTILSRHPPLNHPEPSLSPSRKFVALLSLFIFIVSFAPVPLAWMTH